MFCHNSLFCHRYFYFMIQWHRNRRLRILANIKSRTSNIIENWIMHHTQSTVPIALCTLAQSHETDWMMEKPKEQENSRKNERKKNCANSKLNQLFGYNSNRLTQVKCNLLDFISFFFFHFSMYFTLKRNALVMLIAYTWFRANHTNEHTQIKHVKCNLFAN